MGLVVENLYMCRFCLLAELIIYLSQVIMSLTEQMKFSYWEVIDDLS